MKLASRRDWLDRLRVRPAGPASVGGWRGRDSAGRFGDRLAFSPRLAGNDELVVTTGTRLFN